MESFTVSNISLKAGTYITTNSNKKDINVPPNIYLLLKIPNLNTESVSERDVYAQTVH